MRHARRWIAALPLLLVATPATSQQAPDPALRPPIEKSAFGPGRGPVVLLDEAHADCPTLTGRYAPFADLLRRDGCVVESSKTRCTADALKKARVLVIANALPESARPSSTPSTR